MHGPISGQGQRGRQPSWWCALSICRCRRPASWGAVGSERSCQLPAQWLRVDSIKTCTLWLASNAGPKLKALASSLLVLNLTLLLFTSTLVAAGLLLALFVLDWGVALTAAVVFGAAYGLLAITSNKKLAANSALVAETSRQLLLSPRP